MNETFVKNRIKQIGKVFSGATPKTENLSYWNGDILWITPNDLSKLKFAYFSNTERKITNSGLKSCSANLIPAGSIVLSSRAPIGYIAISQNEFTTNQGCKSIVLNDEHDSLFFFYNLKRYIPKLRQLGEGTTFAEISKSYLENFEVEYPQSKSEQTRIAEILSTADEAIAHTEALIAKYQRIKTGLMQDLLTKGIDENGNIRSKETHKFVVKNGIEVPEEWEVVELAKLVQNEFPIVYGILMPGYGYENGIPVIKVKDIKDEAIILDDILLTSPEIAKRYERSSLIEGDLLFTIRGTVGRCAFVPKELNGSNITQDTARIRVVAITPFFVRYCFELEFSKRYIELHTIGQAVKGINLKELRKMPIPKPSFQESTVIAEKIKTIDDIISTIQANFQKLQSVKTGLMQDLLTGKVRVKTDK